MKEKVELSEEAQKEFGDALKSVCDNILKIADEERKKSEPWKQLFSKSEQGLSSILSKAEDQMMEIALNVATLISEKFNIRCSDKLFDLIRAMPFALPYVEKGIEETQGFACCVDKANKVYYEEVLNEIHRLQEEQKNA